MKKKKNKDISADTLEKLVKNKGDECVTGYVRFKKVRECKGYKDAEDKAFIRLSKIHAGRPLENGTYAAVIRFRMIIWIIPLILLASLIAGLLIRNGNANARERETESVTEYHHVVPLPEMTEPEPLPLYEDSVYAGLYIDVPGYSDCTVNNSSRGVTAYNPENNDCKMKYELWCDDKLITESDILAAGMAEYVDIYDLIKEGENSVSIIVRSYSEDMETEFNSVTQNIKVIKK